MELQTGPTHAQQGIDVKEPTELSKREGHVIPGVVV